MVTSWKSSNLDSREPEGPRGGDCSDDQSQLSSRVQRRPRESEAINDPSDRPVVSEHYRAAGRIRSRKLALGGPGGAPWWEAVRKRPRCHRASAFATDRRIEKGLPAPNAPACDHSALEMARLNAASGSRGGLL